MKLGVNKVKKSDKPGILKKVIPGIKGDYVSKIVFWDIFSDTSHYKFLIFCMMVEGNRTHHLSVTPYFGEILIWGLRGIMCQKFRFLDIFSETGCKFF